MLYRGSSIQMITAFYLLFCLSSSVLQFQIYSLESSNKLTVLLGRVLLLGLLTIKSNNTNVFKILNLKTTNNNLLTKSTLRHVHLNLHSNTSRRQPLRKASNFTNLHVSRLRLLPRKYFLLQVRFFHRL